ncbi:hypothetical protein [Novosphingobium sp. KA1]|uniref:hypothetical protein n=1 Tax=Novosphingobium sp. (strain KA1) TaxID=164608 RepID=UPI001A8D3CC6|nr:hypothetical protein [Novosphingobium sp. KA1]
MHTAAQTRRQDSPSAVLQMRRPAVGTSPVSTIQGAHQVMRIGGNSLLSVLSLGALCLGLLLPEAGAAKDAPTAAPPDLQRLETCRSIASDAERLACFDRESAVFAQSVDSGKLRVIDNEGVKEIRRSLFGFSLPRIGLFGGNEEEAAGEQVNKIQSTLVAVKQIANGKIWFRLSDGAEWQTNDPLGTARMPASGQTIELEKAALGSYWARFETIRAMKAHRVN